MLKFKDNFTAIALTPEARLQLNIHRFTEMIVSRDALTEAVVARSSLLESVKR